VPEDVRTDGTGNVETDCGGAPGHENLQSAVRFPIRLPVAYHCQNQDQEGETRNISANGVLFQADAEMPIGSNINFAISMPAEISGAPNNVVVNCRGRVVRSFKQDDHRWVGVVIDEYGFERR
jgi:PilZ domain